MFIKKNSIRQCIVLKIRIDKSGKKIEHSFSRSLIKTIEALSYEDAQKKISEGDACSSKKIKEILTPLWNAFYALEIEKNARHPLDLELPEQKLTVNDFGEITSIGIKKRLESHKIIEDLMILANRCAAETLENNELPIVYRIHQSPKQEKFTLLSTLAKTNNIKLNLEKKPETKALNILLGRATSKTDRELISLAILRSMNQAIYSPEKHGHFGLNLTHYVHFTSPIRRYTDLIIHRQLVKFHKWDEENISHKAQIDFYTTSNHLSMTERRSVCAERETKDRYIAKYLEKFIGRNFDGHVSGVSKAGLFIRLTQLGAEGLVPISSISNEYLSFDEKMQTLATRRKTLIFKLGSKVKIELLESCLVSGSLIFKIIALEGKKILVNRKINRFRKRRRYR